MLALQRQIRWYIAIRVVAVVSVLLPVFLLQLARPGIFAVEPWVLRLAAATLGATLVYIGLLRLLHRHLAAHAYVQFAGDLLLITVLVYYLGGAASPFTLLYLLIIAVAATLLRRRAGVTIATCAFALYAGLTLALATGWLPPPQDVMLPAAEAPAGAVSAGTHLAAPAATAAALPLSAAKTAPGGTAGAATRGGRGDNLPPGTAEETPSAVAAIRDWHVTYNLAIHFFGFYAMAFLTSFLAHDATRAERELEVKSKHLAYLEVVHRDVIQSISSGLITTDLEGVVTSVNQAGIAILRQNEAELIGSPIHRSGLVSTGAWDEMKAASETGKLRLEVEIQQREDPILVGFSVSRLSDALGAHRGYIVIYQDLSAWRRMQEELRMKDRMAAVGELAAGLAHEIGNPLAAISGSVQMLSTSTPDALAQRRLIEILLKESQRLDRTIKGFLRFARPRERTIAPFDIGRLLSENMELLRNSPEVAESHHLEIDLEPRSARLVADPDQVSQIFWNLARNALRAMPAGGTFRLVGRLDGDVYRLQVVDTGRGMSETERANLFHPFHSFFDGGTGIGMAIVYRIVEEHRGRVRVDSAPGGGTTITVELPAGAGPGLVPHPLPGVSAGAAAGGGAGVAAGVPVAVAAGVGVAVAGGEAAPAGIAGAGTVAAAAEMLGS